jgi:hypothetical protein
MKKVLEYYEFHKEISTAKKLHKFCQQKNGLTGSRETLAKSMGLTFKKCKNNCQSQVA